MASSILNLQPLAAPASAGRTIPWTAAQTFDGASTAATSGGALELRASATPWAYAAAMPIEFDCRIAPAAVGVRFVVDLEVLSGTVGLFAGKQVDTDPLGHEQVLSPSGRVTVRIDGDRSTWRLCIRNREDGHAVVRLHAVRWYVQR